MRKWVLIAGSVFLGGGVLLAAAWLWAGSVAEERIVSRLRDRLQLQAQVGSVGLGMFGTTVRGLHVKRPDGSFEMQVKRLSLDAGALNLILRGTAAIGRAELEDVQVTMDLAAPGLAGWVSALRGPPSQSSETSTKRRMREIAVSDLRVQIRDGRGPLVDLQQVGGELTANSALGRVGRLQLGDTSGDHVILQQLDSRLAASDDGWQLQRFTIDSGRARWVKSEVAGNTDALKHRLQRARRTLWPDAVTQPPVIATQVARPSMSLLTRLDPKVQIRVKDFEIESRTADGGTEQLRALQAEIVGEDEGWLRLRGEGKLSTDGNLEWHLRVRPDEARVEGALRFDKVSMALIAPLFPEIPWYAAEDSSVSAELSLDAQNAARIGVRGELAFHALAFASERIGPEPVTGVSVRLHGEGSWIPAARRLEIATASLETGAARAHIQGSLERTPDHYRIDLAANLPPTDCNDVVDVIPKAALGSVGGFSWKGTLGGELKLVLDSRELDSTVLELQIANACEFQSVPAMARLERFQGSFQHSVVEPEDEVFTMTTGPGTPRWVPFTEISPFLVQAVVSHEDGAFFKHAGFAPWAIRDALVRNLKEGRFAVGASTITMQLAKNLFLHREKNLVRKVQEVILTWWLESALDKEQILELYLNVIEYGPAVYGIGPATEYYFGRTPADLSPAEAAFLACVLPAPKRFHEIYKGGALPAAFAKKMQRLLKHMAKRQRIGDTALAYGLAEIDAFAFHTPGDPPPPPRMLPPLLNAELPSGTDPGSAPDFPEIPSDPWELQDDSAF